MSNSAAPGSVQEAQANVEEFAIQLLIKLHEKKTIDNDIKELKQTFKEEGVPVQIVSSIINRIKADKKKSESEIFEAETIREWLELNSKIDDSIGMLVD